MDLHRELSAVLPAEALVPPGEDLSRWQEGWRYGDGRAAAVVRPSSTAEVSLLLAHCSARAIRVVPQGGNTGLVGASVPDGSGTEVVLSLDRLNRRLEIDVPGRTATVDGGVRLSALDAAAEPHGLFFPIDLGADPSIGGMVATNTGGSRLLRYGDVRRNLLGVELVLGDGTVVSALHGLRKNNTGLDVGQALCGTFGALGVVTAAVVNLVPRPRQRTAAFVAASSGEAAIALLAALEREAGELLSAFEGISAAALEPVFRHHPSVRNPWAGAAVPAYSLLVELSTTLPRAALDLPALLESALVAHLESGAEGIDDVRFAPAEELWAVRHSISESLRLEGKVVGLDLSVPRAALPAFTRAVRARLAESAPFVRVCDFGHFGDGGTHLNLVFREPDAGGDPAAFAARLQAEVYELCVTRFGGSFSAEHGVGPHNQATYDRFTPPAVKSLARAIAKVADPASILSRVRLG